MSDYRVIKPSLTYLPLCHALMTSQLYVRVSDGTV